MTPPGTAIVTGASRGLGYELCRLYLRRGWRVLPLVRRAGDAAFAAAAPARCTPVVADLASSDAPAVIRDRVAGATRSVDVLINNAGTGGRGTRLAEVAAGEIGDLLAVHCLGVLRCTQAVLPMLAAGRSPKVINVTSRVGSFARTAAGDFDGGGISYAYRVAKAAQNMLTLAMSRELREHGILVCAVHPGEFASELNPGGAESAAGAAERLADWIDGVTADHHGLCHDPRSGPIPW